MDQPIIQMTNPQCPSASATNRTLTSNGSSSLFCHSYADNMTCWPTTPVGTFAVVPCPKYYDDIELFPGNVTKLCYGNGTWHNKANYSQCVEPLGLFSPLYFHNYVYTLIYYTGFSISVVALFIALFLFLYFRCLRCLRNKIHCHLIMTFILKYLLWLKMVPTMSFLAIEDASQVHQWICKSIMTLFNYLLVTNFFWMLIEGLYLHTVLVWAFAHDRLRFWHYAILGWCVPAVFIVAWAIVKAKNDNNTCWLPNNTHYDYIFIAPIFLVLFGNVVFLSSIVWILVTKLKASHSSQNCLYTKAAKATLILFPLLGMTYLLLLFAPGNKIVISYINVVLQSTQGLFVATFYCFLNVEVQNTVKKYLSRWKEGRKFSMRTQTSIVTQGEQISLRATSRDDVQSKTRGGIRQIDSLKLRSDELPRTGSRNYVNGLNIEHTEKSPLNSEDIEETINKGEKDGGPRRLRIPDDSEDAGKCQDPWQVNEEDDELDITKEDLV